MAFDIAVVDAETATRRNLALALAPVGYRVVSFADADSALHEILANPPRLVIADLLLPDLDGFELFQRIRSALGDRIELLCTSGVEWGEIDLAEVLSRRFRARLLKKPFLKSELRDLVRTLIGGEPKQTSFSGEWRIGVEDAKRVDELSFDFEQRIARVGLNRGRCSVRRPFECAVLVKSSGDFVRCAAKNISTKGLFVEMIESAPENWPAVDETLDVCIDPAPLGRTLRARARVAFRLSEQEALAQSAPRGFGMEFIELPEEDRRNLEFLVRSLRQENDAERPHEPTASSPAPVIWVLLVGIVAEELLRRPGFLHRQGIEIMSVATTEAAVDFTEEHSPALCVVDERALGTEPGSALAPLAQNITGRRIVVVGHTSLSSLVTSGLCDAVLPSDTPIELLLEELRERLGVAQRRAPRVPAQAEVKIYGGPAECQANMVNVSTGGMLLRSSQPAPIGAHVSLDFDLPGAAGIRCGALVVRSEPNPQGTAHLLGLSFSDMDESAAQALSRFVESHVHFRDYFAWLKRAYFEGRS